MKVNNNLIDFLEFLLLRPMKNEADHNMLESAQGGARHAFQALHFSFLDLSAQCYEELQLLVLE